MSLAGYAAAGKNGFISDFRGKLTMTIFPALSELEGIRERVLVG
jgi:hypothetical protein